MIKFIKSSEKKEILKKLDILYGIKELPYLLIERGKERIRAFSGNLSKEELSKLIEITNVELIGMYMISAKDEDLRLSFDSISLLRKKITKSIFTIDENQYNLWIRGYDLEIEIPSGMVILSYDKELVGLGKSNGKKI